MESKIWVKQESFLTMIHVGVMKNVAQIPILITHNCVSLGFIYFVTDNMMKLRELKYSQFW